MNEFEIGGHTYKARKMDAMTQLHVTRRLSPLIGAFKDALPKREEGQGLSLMDVQIAPLASALSGMPDDVVDYVISNTLSLVQRKMDGDRGWAPVWTPVAKRPMFDDIGMIDMLSICIRVVLDNIGPFSLGDLLK